MPNISNLYVNHYLIAYDNYVGEFAFAEVGLEVSHSTTHLLTRFAYAYHYIRCLSFFLSALQYGQYRGVSGLTIFNYLLVKFHYVGLRIRALME